MQKNLLIAGLLLLLGCTRHNDAPLTPSELLLTSSPWKLQRSDSFFLANDGLTVTSTNSFHAADCSQQPHYIFNTDHTVRGYMQCDPPADRTSSWTWRLDPTQLTLDGHIRSGGGFYPPYYPADTVVTLTKDSLVIHQHIISLYPFANPLTTVLPSHAVFLIERYTH